MPDKKARLRVARIDTVGFVDRGDNPPAEIVLWKRKPEESDMSGGNDDDGPDRSLFRRVVKALGDGFGFKADELDVMIDGLPANKEGGEGDDAVKEFKLEDLPEVAQEEFKKLQDKADEVDELTSTVEALKAEVEKLTPEPDPEPEPEPEVSAEVQKQLDDAEKRADDAEARLAKLEGEKRRGEFIGKAADLTGLPGFQADDGGEILDKIEEALGPEEFEKFFGILKGSAEAIRKGELFRVLGSGESPLGSVEQEVAEAVAEVQKAKPALSAVQARAEVWKNNSALYERYERERAARVQAAEG